MKVAFVTGVWKRPDVFKMFARGIHQLRQIEGLEIFTIVAGSEGEVSRTMVQMEGFKYIEMPNQPLAIKMNATLIEAKKYNVDYVMCLGSDDVIGVGLMKEYLKHMNNGIDFIGVLDFYFYDLVSKRSIYWSGYTGHRKGHTCGAGRCVSKSFLDKMHWNMWEIKDNGMLDSSLQRKLKEIQHTSIIFKCKDTGTYGLDIKSKTNMTPFFLWENAEFIDSEEIEKEFEYLFDKPLFHDSNQIHPTAIIYDNVVLGKNNVIGAYTVIGSNGEMRGVEQKDFKGKVIIGDNNVISEFVSIQRPYNEGQTTVIGNNNIIMAHSHFGHDVKLGNNCEVCTGVILGGYSIINDNTKIKLGVTVRNRKIIGENCIIGMGSVVVKDVMNDSVIMGNPAKSK